MFDADTDTRVQQPLDCASTPARKRSVVPVADVDAQMRAALEFLSQGSIVGDKLKALGRLLNKSVNDSDTLSELQEAAHLAVDIMEVLATRLDGFETQALAQWDHFRAELER